MKREEYPFESGDARITHVVIYNEPHTVEQQERVIRYIWGRVPWWRKAWWKLCNLFNK